MTATLILWGHALAALLFVAVTVGMRSRRSADLPARALGGALVLTALWALAVAGIDARDVATRLAGAARDVAWLVVLMTIARRAGVRGSSLAALQVAAIGLAVLVAALATAEAAIPPALGLGVALREARLVLHAMQLLAGLVIVHALLGDAGARSSPVRLVGLAVAALWSADLLPVAAASIGWTAAAATLVALRGMVVAGAALLVAAAAAARDEAALAVSRATTARLLLIPVLTAYAGLTASLTAAAPLIGGGHERLVQTAIVFGATAALLTLLSTPWLRGWGKVMVAKHLFTHRYDYRAEWLRFSETVGRTVARTGDATAPLDERVARAMAELTVSPAALLLGREGDALVFAAAWGWPDGSSSSPTAALVRHLADTQRILDLDAIRAGAAPVDAAAVPDGLLAQPRAWAIAPLIHHSELVGAVVLARPPIDRALDWEDFDLLRVAGRQAAGVLADERTRAALADAERFDEFNRRFAFILHDIKNLVSQLSLVARNAERHADNPAFRADMVATLRESSDRMQALLARLSPQAPAREPVEPVDAARLVVRLCRRSGAIAGDAASGAWLLADAAALDTVLDHLVQNATEASAPGEPVVVEVSEDGTEVAIAIADRGRGMAAGFVRDRLFRPFVSTKPGGFGLGAFEARQMVEAMGGRLLVDSREQGGTRMTVLLPAAAIPAREAA